MLVSFSLQFAKKIFKVLVDIDINKISLLKKDKSILSTLNKQIKKYKKELNLKNFWKNIFTDVIILVCHSITNKLKPDLSC